MKKLLSACLLGMFAMSSFAQSSAAKEGPIGLLLKDRRTNEVIGLRCESKGAEGICESFQFLLLEEVSKKEMSLVAKLGRPVGHDYLQRMIDNIKSSAFSDVRKYSFINNNGVGTGDGDLTDVSLDGHMMAISGALITFDNDYTLAGKIWRRTLGVVTFPLFLAVDGARYAAEALAAAGEVVGESIAFGVVGATYDLPNTIHANSNAKKVEKSMRGLNQKRNKNKITKLSHRKFMVIKKGIEEYAN